MQTAICTPESTVIYARQDCYCGEVEIDTMGSGYPYTSQDIFSIIECQSVHFERITLFSQE